MHPYENKMGLSFSEVLGNSGLNDTIKYSVIRSTTYVKINQQYIQRQIWPSFFVCWTPVNRVSYKTTIVCPSLSSFGWSVQHFS